MPDERVVAVLSWQGMSAVQLECAGQDETKPVDCSDSALAVLRRRGHRSYVPLPISSKMPTEFQRLETQVIRIVQHEHNHYKS